MVLEEFYIIMRDLMTAHHCKSGPLKIPPRILDTYRLELEQLYSFSDEYRAEDRKGVSLIVDTLRGVTSSVEEEFGQMLDELRQKEQHFAVD
jgi:hypothetical protein